MRRKALICAVLSFIVLVLGCEYSNNEVYSSTKYAQISKLVKDNDECIRNCYDFISDIKGHDITFIYVNSETIETTDLNGDITNTNNTRKELQAPFRKLKGLRGITTLNNSIDFGGWGSITSSIGFIYSPDNSITIKDILPVDVSGEINIIDQNTYFWKQTNGDNSVFFKRITTYYYYYEIWF
ncbi:MAG: hypothetical protein IJK88_02295 [Clostridia bacterium]|nr:hypothetical protein [Clostridia bacterium]